MTTSAHTAGVDPGATVELSGDFMHGRFRDMLRRFRRQRTAAFAASYIVFLVLFVAVAPLLLPHEALDQNLSNRFAGPSGTHWLGTDELGRDILARLTEAGRVSLFAAFLAVAIASALGVVPGLVAGYFGGRIDWLIMRATDVAMSFQPLLLAIAVVGVLGPGLTNAMIAIGIVFAPRFLRLVRASAWTVRSETYIDAAVTIGMPTTRIMRLHVLPNVVAPLIVQTSLAMGFAMLAEASLSFLGLGVQLPDASWGSMLGRARSNFGESAMLAIAPGLMIALSVLAFNVFGDGLRDSIGREERK